MRKQRAEPWETPLCGELRCKQKKRPGLAEDEGGGSQEEERQERATPWKLGGKNIKKEEVSNRTKRGPRCTYAGAVSVVWLGLKSSCDEVEKLWVKKLVLVRTQLCLVCVCKKEERDHYNYLSCWGVTFE